jgi:hypothetical protein
VTGALTPWEQREGISVERVAEIHAHFEHRVN